MVDEGNDGQLTVPELGVGFSNSTHVEILESYKNSPTARAVVSVASAFTAGIAGGIETVILAALDKHKELRLATLIKGLQEEQIHLDERTLGSDSFIHNVAVVVRASERARQSGKVRLFARLLAGYYRGDPVRELDEFDEFARVLEDLSAREFTLLNLLRDFEAARTHDEGKNPLKNINMYWDVFTTAASSRLGYEGDSLRSELNSLMRTGLYAQRVFDRMGFA